MPVYIRATCGVRYAESEAPLQKCPIREDERIRAIAIPHPRYLGGHLPATTTGEVSRLATHARCKLEISAIAGADE